MLKKHLFLSSVNAKLVAATLTRAFASAPVPNPQPKMQALGQSMGSVSLQDVPAYNTESTKQYRKVKNLLSQSLEEKQRFMHSFDDIMADCDGKENFIYTVKYLTHFWLTIAHLI